MALNEFQLVAREAYAQGDFSHTDEIFDVGDGLYTAIMVELSDNEDCENLETAIQRLEAMRRDIDTVLEALDGH